jgi:hypothetical protein
MKCAVVLSVRTLARSEDESPDPTSGELRRQKLTGGKIRISDDRGQLEVWIPRSSMIVFRFDGYASPAFGPAQIEIASRSLTRAPKLEIFNDWYGVTSYDVGLRKAVTDWAQMHLKQLVIHCLIRSPLIAMGLEVSRLTLGAEIYPMTDKRVFEQKLERALGNPFKRPPTS